MDMASEVKNKHAGEYQQQSTGVDWTMTDSQDDRSQPTVEGEWPIAVLSFKKRPRFKISKRLGKNWKRVMDPDKTRNQDLLYWWEPAEIYPTDKLKD
jgi:hypothetical protein